MNYKTLNHKTNTILKKASNTKLGIFILAFWAALEPSIWFIAADMPLQIMSITEPKKYKKIIHITFIAALLGASIYFFLNMFYFTQLRTILLTTPFVKERMFDTINTLLNTYGLLGLLTQAFTFISIKIWTSIAVERSIPFLPFIMLTGISRYVRFFISGYTAKYIGERYTQTIKDHTLTITIIYILCFFAILVILETNLFF